MSWRVTTSAALLLILGITRSASADWLYNPTNGHRYEYTHTGSWTSNEAEAVSMGGHLVTINDSTEQGWLNANFPFGEELWIGFYQDVNAPDYSEPAGGWKWISGESSVYLNWRGGEPNNSGGAESYAAMHNGGVGQWNDYPITQALLRGIVERETPVPSVSTWGITIMGVLLLTVGSLAILRLKREGRKIELPQ